MTTIVVWRFLQAFGGSVVPMIVQAMVRDLYGRNESARILSLNMLVTASAPIVAPLIGGQVLLWFDWRAIFWVLVAFGVVALVAALLLPETLDPSRRNKANPLAMLTGYFRLLRAPRYVGYVACSTFYFFCLFAFLAGSPFVYIEYFGVRPQYYGFLFGVNMIGMIAASYLNSRIVTRYGADRILRFACTAGAAFSLILLVTGIGGYRRHRRHCIAVVPGAVASDGGGIERDFRCADRRARSGRGGCGAGRCVAIRRRRGGKRGDRPAGGRHPAADGYHHLCRRGAGLCRQSDVAAARPRLGLPCRSSLGSAQASRPP